MDVLDMTVVELSKRSETYRKYVDQTGLCHSCKEWTDVLEPCCGFPVEVEGSGEDSDVLWELIEDEVRETLK